MRILLISARYLPHRGGLESAVYHLAQEFVRCGHHVQIITNRYPRSLAEDEEIDGVKVTRLHFLLPALKYLRAGRLDLWFAGLWYGFHTRQALRRIINEFQPDIINNHYLNEVAEFSQRFLAAHSPVIPWVISLHGGDVDGEPLLSSTNKERFSRLSQQANELTACSAFLSDQASALEPRLKGKIQVIHNGVDVSSFANAKPCPADRPYILAVGQLSSHKGFDLLIEAFSQVAEKYPNADLWFAGDGAQHAALVMLTQQKNLTERVKFLGGVTEAMVASLMAGCLFLAIPSRREPFGIVALEGMAAGKPVLASHVGGLSEFLLVPPNRLIVPGPGDWGAAMDEWLGLAMSGNLHAVENVQEARKHDWHAVALEYLQVYEHVLRHD